MKVVWLLSDFVAVFLNQMSESRGFPCLEQVTVGSLLVGEASLGWSCGVLSGLFGCFTVALGDMLRHVFWFSLLAGFF